MKKPLKITFIGVIIFVIVSSVWLYSSANQWNQCMVESKDRKDINALSTRVEVINSGADARRNEDKKQPVDGKSSAGVDQRVRDILYTGLAKLDEDVLAMDIGAIVGPPVEGNFMENRLLAKVQRADSLWPERCVIRVAIVCMNEGSCSVIQGTNGSLADIFTWQKISCLPSLLPCDIERRLVDTMTPDVMKQSDVVILGLVGGPIKIDKLMALRPPGQLWVFMTVESPLMRERHFVPKNPGGGNPYNLTVYYTHDSDLYAPYAHFQKRKMSKLYQPPNKTKLISWLASHCTGMPWRRTEFVKYLQQYVDIDIYGKCGDLDSVARNETLTVLQEYKFYLALENNECQEYITEKASKNAFRSGTVPIVYGSRPQDYARIFPPNSYIHLQEFDSIGDFVDYIQLLDNDVERYNQYFDWHKEGTMERYSIWYLLKSPQEVSICYIVRKMVHVSVYPETSWQTKVPDFEAWMREQCSSNGTKAVLGFDVHDFGD